MRVVFSAEAEADLEEISDYIARDSPRRAATFVEELIETCIALAEFPAAFPLLPRHPEKAIRRRRHGNYLIFYRVDPDAISVIHILHGARDYEEILFPEA